MFPRLLGRHYDERRLRWLLAALFLALAVPTAAVLWQAYGQLKWEAYHQLRGQAEELTERIDASIAEGMAAAEERSFAEYSFLNISGDPDAGFVQRSPLSAYPVVQDLPGVIGYFQLDSEGRFSTPLLPDSESGASALGLNNGEFGEREALAGRMRRILAESPVVEGREADDKPPSQEFFDELAQEMTQGARLGNEAEPEFRQRSKEARAGSPAGPNQYGKIEDLRLNDALQKKSESLEEEQLDRAVEFKQPSEAVAAPSPRSRRVEQSVLPETVVTERLSADADQLRQDVRITTFQSEVDPFEFAMLASGELVLFRKVWRDSERYVQGILIDQARFLDEAVVSPFRATTLSAMSDLLVGFGDDVIRVANAEGGRGYSGEVRAMEGELLYRSQLSSPLDAMALIYSVRRLPAGPGAPVLGWTTILLAAVFGGGFLAMYRLGVGQIRLARQQQDFVSSVSHELKTPLTSIRMYSEMLKEGWADDERRQQYYEFIHDESERLSRLISNVLQLASITRGEPTFELAPVTAGELLDRVRSKIASLAERAGFEVAIEAQAESRAAVVEVDEDCMMQILINLVDNALKFSRNAAVKRVEIGAQASSDGTVRFWVRDYGPGIPREQIRKIFRLFYRPQSELTRETVGTGIGLAIVHQLAQAMGGTVDVLNRDPGAEFGITFPCSRKIGHPARLPSRR